MTERHQRKLAAIMFSDMVGYTALMQEDELKARMFRDRCRAALRELVVKHDGAVLQFYGDGVLCSFASAIEATKCAIEVQQKLQQEPKVPVRIGIHVGDVVFEDEGVYGDGVNVASRIEQLAAPGGICFSEKVYDEVKNQPGMETVSLGKVQLKNVKRPIEIFALTGEGLAVPERLPSVEKILTQIQRDLESEKADERLVKKGSPLSNVAVLPFVNMSPDPENEYFSDGITEEVINMLAKVEGLRVASRTSAFAFKGKSEDIRSIGGRLSVGSVVEGSVRKEGKRLRITAQLINIADGYHLWSETFERELKDVFAIQDEISQAIVENLRGKLIGETGKKVDVCCPRCDPDAYTLYLKGRYYWNKWTSDGWKKSIEYFRQALEKDPVYAQAYAGIADAYDLLGTYNLLHPNDAFPKARAAAAKALELDPKLSDAHVSLAIGAMFYERNWTQSEREFQRALELNSGYAGAHHAYAVLLTILGRFDEATREILRARDLDPLSIPINLFVGWVLYYTRRYDEALGQIQKTLEMEPNFPIAHFGLGSVYLRKAMFDKAIEEFQKGVGFSGGSNELNGALAVALALSGNKEEARVILEKLEGHTSGHDVPWISLVVTHESLGNRDRAFEWLNRAYEERASELAFLKIEPAFDPLRPAIPRSSEKASARPLTVNPSWFYFPPKLYAKPIHGINGNPSMSEPAA